MFRIISDWLKILRTMEPITNVCIVADIYRCPPKYELVIMPPDSTYLL